MTAKPVVRRAAADRDVEIIIDHYLEAAGTELALGFVDALEQAYFHLGKHPGTGSPKHAHHLGIPGLGSWPLDRFPYLVFYFEKATEVQVWRVLHDKLDLPAWLGR